MAALWGDVGCILMSPMGCPWTLCRDPPAGEDGSGEGPPGSASGGSALGLWGICPPPLIRTKVSRSVPLAGFGLRWDSQRLFLSPDVSGPADPIAPAIIIPPKNTSVVAGSSEVTMECVANARWVLPPPPLPTLAPAGTSDLQVPRRPGAIHKGPEMSREDPRKKMGYLAWRRVGGQRAVGHKQGPPKRSVSRPRTSGVGGGSTHF